MKRYDPVAIEKKWQKIWTDNKTYAAKDGDQSKPKLYATEMFPYPSGAGLHVGHVRNFTIVDVLARFYRQQGFNVLRPIGWDTFGLPAENYAIKNGVSPKESTKVNIANFKKQYQRLGMAVDWSREINTSDPEYYKWTQWCFLQLFKNNLAYQKDSFQWWCPVDKTVLANEQVENGKCWRCGSEVEKKRMNQWFFRITEYADELLADLDNVDWPQKIKTMQRNWIGRSQGAQIEFAIADHDKTIKAFTTRPDTIFGANFLVLAPEHELAVELADSEHGAEVADYCKKAIAKTEIERQSDKEKTGVFTGSYAINPATGKRIPIWIADYVLGGYGEGAIMAVPAHDERDHEFASKYGLPITKVIQPTNSDKDEEFYAGEGVLINSGDFNGIDSSEARETVANWLEEQGIGQVRVQYKMRDWLISRQRYWGAPIPIIHCDNCGVVPVPESDLPVVLPDIDDYLPSGDGRSPLSKIADWVNVDCPKCGNSARRETDTMDGYACSSWYIYRYADPNNGTAAWDKDKVNYWAPLDFYVGGDHAVAHLLYVRFWAKFFHKIGLLDFDEPVKRLLYNGYINAPDGLKMSKSKGNVIDPLDIIDSGYGADTLRMYEMFIGPYDMDAAWNTGGIGGVYRFLNRCWSLVGEYCDSKFKQPLSDDVTKDLLRAKNLAIKNVTEDLHNNQYNTAVSTLMEYVNSLTKLKSSEFDETEWPKALSCLCQLMAPFSPHIANEMFTMINGDDVLVDEVEWPKHDEKYLITDTINIAVQINGKLRGEISVAADLDKESVIKVAKNHENVSRYLHDVTIVKEIYVPGKIVNIVAK